MLFKIKRICKKFGKIFGLLKLNWVKQIVKNYIVASSLRYSTET